MANNESKVLASNSFEEWRRASNEVSYHLGDIDQFDARLGDKVYTYSASADQQFFLDGESDSKILRFEFTSSKVCNANEQVKSLQIKTDVLSSKDLPVKKGYSERFFN